jgi:hypothetical protein
VAKPRLPREHGTERGYRQQHAEGEVPTTANLVAHSAYVQKRRNRGRCAPGLGWPLEASRG